MNSLRMPVKERHVQHLRSGELERLLAGVGGRATYVWGYAFDQMKKATSFLSYPDYPAVNQIRRAASVFKVSHQIVKYTSKSTTKYFILSILSFSEHE